jgi:tRNA(Ile2)-agmatinylcytidine synthase
LTMFIGVDDTDSTKGLCTTYLAAVMMERLSPLGELRGLPRLVRLNPCAQFKTRGNAAIAFQFESDRPYEVREVALDTVKELSDLEGENTNPGLIVADEMPEGAEKFYKRAVTEILEIYEAREILESQGVWHRGFKKGMGLIGALAAIGANLDDRTYVNVPGKSLATSAWDAIGANLVDRTYELIAYRERGRWGTPRSIDPESVWRADAQTYPGTWDTVDCKNRRVVFAPHSGDPVLFGIRGDDLSAIETAFEAIISEPLERKILYITNQGTDAHILRGEISDVEENRSYRLQGSVLEAPKAIEGGHVFFSIASGRKSLACAAFEPTKDFREVVKNLVPGDQVEIYGAVKDKTLNLEKIEILELAKREVQESPLCHECGRRMKSAGKGQGYRCKSCKTKAEARETRIIRRDLDTGFYEVPPSARRHLSKPLVRIKGEKTHPSR